MQYTFWGTALVVGMLTIGFATDANGQRNEASLDSIETTSLILDARKCLALSEVTGGRGVVPADGGAYQPGIDAYGRSVVPAEGRGLGPDWSGLGENIRIDVAIDVVERYGVNLPPGSLLPLGTIEIRDGRAWFNGQPLAGHDREALWQACRRLGAQP